MSKIQVDSIVNKDDTGGVDFPKGVTVTGVVTATSFTGNVTGNATGLTGTPNIIVGVVTATEGLTLDGQNGSGKGLKLDLAGSGDYTIQETTANDTVQFGGTGSANFFRHNVSSGNIGIGTTGDATLHVFKAGDGQTPVHFQTGNANGHLYFYNDSDGYSLDSGGNLRFVTNRSSSGTPTRMMIASDGKCTFSPAGSVIGIEVNANGSAQAAVFNNSYSGDSSPTVKITTSGTNGVAPALNVEDNFFVYGGGRVSSLATYNNTTGSAANTHVDSNGIFYRSTSSAKYKTDIETLEDQYADAILGVRPVWYRSTCEADNPDWGLWGFIAEEVAEIDPRLCFLKENEDGSLEPEGVQYDRFVPHLVNLIKRQKERIETLEAQNAAILARLDALEAG